MNKIAIRKLKKRLSIVKHGPRRLYADMQTLKNEYLIKKKKTEWPLNSLFEIIWIDPADVIGTMRENVEMRYRGRRLPGDWDGSVIPIEDTVDYYVLYNRFIKGKDWEQILSDYQNEIGSLRYDYINKVLRLADARDELFRDMKRSGWKLSDSLGCSYLMTDELNINIARDGAFIRNHSAMHRLIISRFIGLKRVPCRIHVVHSDFNASISDVTYSSSTETR